MAAVAHDFGIGAAWVDRFDALAAELDGLAFCDVQELCRVGRSKLDAIETRRLAAEIGTDGDSSRARRMAAGDGARSRKAASDAAKRAKAVAKNSKLADDLAAGDLSTEQLDTIADAAEADESAAVDEEFIDAIKDRSVDQGRMLARDRKNKRRDGESEHRRQRRARKAATWKDQATGLSHLKLTGDDATIDELWNLITQQEKRLREADGGRDLPSSKHPRSLNQRLFDAAAELMRTTGSGAGFARPSIVVTVPVDGSAASVVGGGPLPHDAVIDLLSRADVSMNLLDALTNEPLAHGRLKRHATAAQFLALVVRDRGCVHCGANWIRCEAHHTTPWHSPAAGKTNTDEMALLCTSCHHHLHAADLTLYRDDQHIWRTRPSTPAETPPPQAVRRAATTAPKRAQHHEGNRPPADGVPPEQRPPGLQDRPRPGSSTSEGDNPSLFRRPGSAHQRPGLSKRPAAADDEADSADG